MGAAQAVVCLSCLTGFLLLLRPFPPVCQATGWLSLSAFKGCEAGPFTCLHILEPCAFLQVVQNEPLRFPESPQISEELKDLLLRMLAKVSPHCGYLLSPPHSIVNSNWRTSHAALARGTLPVKAADANILVSLTPLFVSTDSLQYCKPLSSLWQVC